MFSQRNNPYCDLLHFSVTKLERKTGETNISHKKLVALENNPKDQSHEAHFRIRFRNQQHRMGSY